MKILSKVEKERLYLKVRHELGWPLRPFEIQDEMLDSYLEMAVEDYSALINEWLIHQQWINLEGMTNTENSDFLSAFTTKSNDYMKSFTYAYSKQVGMGTNAPAAPGWELKRDFIITSGHTQHYIIPAGREVNEVLWETPPIMHAGVVDPFALNNWSPGMTGWGYMGRPAMYVQPTFSTLLSAQDRRMKQRVLQSLLTYRITGLETGEKILHLYPAPDSREEIRGTWGKHHAGKKVWYWYYETGSQKEREQCQEENPDVVTLPSDPPASVLRWERINDMAKRQIRDLLIAKTKMVIGSVRGFYSGELGVAEKSLTMDYRHLLDDGEALRERTVEKIKEQLEKLSQVNLTEERANIADNVNRHLEKQPIRFPIIPI
jgi:hypothetical protein